jgi:hypothetical protein
MNRTGSYPFRNIAEEFRLPYEVVLLYADYLEAAPERFMSKEASWTVEQRIAHYGFWPTWGFCRVSFSGLNHEHLMRLCDAVRKANNRCARGKTMKC